MRADVTSASADTAIDRRQEDVRMDIIEGAPVVDWNEALKKADDAQISQRVNISQNRTNDCPSGNRFFSADTTLWKAAGTEH